MRSVLALLLLAGTATVSSAAEPGRLPGRGGEPLPFRDDDAALAFLREARVIASQRAPGGVTGARKLLLEREGVEAHAIFRRVAVWKAMRVVDGRFARRVRDHHANEVAAYELSRLLGFDTIPPTVARTLDGTRGSLQLWVEGAQTEKSFRERELTMLERARHGLQVDQMKVFDNLIYNMDRNQGNYLTDASGRVWYVDHTRSFPRLSQLPEPDRRHRLRRELWRRLRETPDAALAAAVEPWVDGPSVDALLKRRRLVVAALEDQIQREGSLLVLFDLETWARPAS